MIKDIFIEMSEGSHKNLGTSLREREKIFEYIYRDFFNNHNLVLSGHSVLTWGTDISHGISSLRIKQKLPMKIFCGANLNNSGKVTFGTSLGYCSADNLFQEDELRVFSGEESDKVSLLLQKFLRSNGFSQGISIDILSEIPSGHGFASSGVISVLLTFLVYIFVGKLDPKILTYQELSAHKDIMEELYLFSLSVSNCISGGKSIGATNYAVMVQDSPLPIVHFSQKDTDQDSRGGNIMNDDNTDIHIPTHRTLYKGILATFFGIDSRNYTELPVDYGIIFNGILYKFSDVVNSRQNKRHEERGEESSIIKMMDSLDINEDDRGILKKSIYTQKDGSIDKDADMQNFKILNGFNELLVNKGSDQAVENFIQIIHQVGLQSFSYQKENRFFLAFQYLFHQYAQFPDEVIGIFPFNTGKIGGSLLFVIKKGRSQLTIQKVLDKLGSDGYTASLDYASWKDGYAAEGVQVEQYISEKIYSLYTKEGDLLFKDTLGRSYSGEYDSILRNENTGILLDTVGGRIYIKGKKLTSKDIHSQNTTIDMLKILIENIGKEVSNTKLPISTYSQNKNEILGKVVLPIKKIAKECFGVELSLTCSGGITDYYLRLERDEGIAIGIIKKLYD